MLTFKVSRKAKVYIPSVSALVGVGIALFATFLSPGYQVRPLYDNYVLAALIVALIPPSVIDLADRRWRNAVDSKLPDLIRDIADSQKTGMSFMKSIEHSARLNYGPLSKELNKTVGQITWGMPYDEALSQLAKRVDTPLAHRTTALLNEVGRSGGRLAEILDDIYNHIKEVQDLERDRKRQIGPYIMVIYASFGIYLFVVFILFSTFFEQIKEVIKTGSPFLSGVNPATYHLWFFHMSAIQSMMGGMVAGKMGEGSMSAGIKHMLLLLVISMVLFWFVIRA